MRTPSQEKHLSATESKKQIARVDGNTLTPEIFATKYQKHGIPVVITGLLDSDELNWDLDYLRKKLGQKKFPVRFYGRERYQQDKRNWENMGSGVESRTIPFSDYAEKLLSGEADEKDIYLGKCSLTNTPLADNPSFQRLESQLGLSIPVTPLNLWVGLGGHTTCLHCDAFDGTLIQLYGAKKLILFPPNQLYNLYPFSLLNNLLYGFKRRASYSQIYPQKPDFQAFPKFKKALSQSYEVVLNQREILYIPVGWWHEVTCLGDGVVCSVNRFWRVLPIYRSFFSWNKWRIHLSSILAIPHFFAIGLTNIIGKDRKENLNRLLQRL
ncbi:MAG: cupin-like domain-containing protein [Richelia sp. RM2_1_2]|nr:cupin-like domain-containing protein [Richelia sp. SM1_7_0]NJN08459.1 cupin-like domain-containing protein [Richelia sp. RM1_1_1]NJO27039.1 cupin-like domain-containing protein [Richelia sp. SL_2_1]NJO62935.1 cupin-like domain-containing protein [Richelia sp. RM2_1_2]